MTENEAIKDLKVQFELPFGSWISEKTLKVAIKALEEIQKYRAIGTVEECREAMERQREKNSMRHLAKKLKEYEDLEEQCRLLKLPCAVGDTVYTLNPLPSGKIVIGETTADAFMCALGMLKGRFGETIFLTNQEAAAKLAEMVIPNEKQ